MIIWYPIICTRHAPLPISTTNTRTSRSGSFTFPAPRLTVLESPATDLNGTEPPIESEETEPTTTATPTNDSTATDPAHATEQPVTDGEDDSDEDEGTNPSPDVTLINDDYFGDSDDSFNNITGNVLGGQNDDSPITILF